MTTLHCAGPYDWEEDYMDSDYEEDDFGPGSWADPLDYLDGDDRDEYEYELYQED